MDRALGIAILFLGVGIGIILWSLAYPRNTQIVDCELDRYPAFSTTIVAPFEEPIVEGGVTIRFEG